MKRRTICLLVAAATLVLALPWLGLIPMGVWRGVAVIEPCDRKAQDRFGPVPGVYAVRGEEYVRLFPPAWVCPLDNGETVTVSAVG